MLAAAKSCAGKWLANSTRWGRCLPNTTTPPEKPPVLTTLTVTVSVIAGGGGMVVVEELEHALARGATSMLKSLATAQPLMAQTWLLRLAKVQCAA